MVLIPKKRSGVLAGVFALFAILVGGAGAPLFAGVIDDAPTFSQAFLRMLDFLLEIFGFLVIIGFVIAGALYFTAFGDTTRVALAKKAFLWSIIGTAVGLGAYVLVLALAKFFAA